MTMKRYIFIMFLSFFTTFSNAQSIKNKDYEIINQLTNDLKKDYKSAFIKAPLALHIKSLNFNNQSSFFTKETFDSYTYTPISSSDKKKIMKLSEKVDFKYLADQNRDTLNWDFTRLVYPFKKYNENLPEEKFRLGFSLPIYSVDQNIAFIFHTIPCQHAGCGATVVKVYKKTSCGKWKMYLNIPVGFD